MHSHLSLLFSCIDLETCHAISDSRISTRVGCMLLTGYTTPFHEQPIAIRTAILERWRLSYLPPLQVMYKQMTVLGKNFFLKTSPSYSAVSGFPKVPQHWKAGPHFEYEFLQFTSGSGPEILDTDVVIVGSSCGGAVCAKNLAEAGHRVLVLEKSYYYPPSSLPMSESDGLIHLYENAGALGSDDASITVSAPLFSLTSLSLRVYLEENPVLLSHNHLLKASLLKFGLRWLPDRIGAAADQLIGARVYTLSHTSERSGQEIGA